MKTRRQRALTSLLLTLSLIMAFPAMSQAWDDYKVEIDKVCLVQQAQPNTDFDCDVPVENVYPKSHSMGYHDFFVVGFRDTPGPGLTCTPLKLSGRKGQELARIAPRVSTVLIGGAEKVHVFKVRCHVGDVEPGTDACNSAVVTVTNWEDKPKDTPPVTACVHIVAPPVAPPAVQPPAAQPPAPPTALPPVIATPAPKATPKTPKAKRTRCKVKSVSFKLTRWIWNKDPRGNYRRSSTDETKKCRYADPAKHLRLVSNPFSAPFNPFETITLKVTGNGPYVDIRYVKYWVEDERRGPVEWRAPYAHPILAGKFGKLGEHLNEWKKTNATGKAWFYPLTKYPS